MYLELEYDMKNNKWFILIAAFACRDRGSGYVKTWMMK